MIEYQCRRLINGIRCQNKMLRENLGDAFDYPDCDKCRSEIFKSELKNHLNNYFMYEYPHSFIEKIEKWIDAFIVREEL
jgi:hypothetical protein